MTTDIWLRLLTSEKMSFISSGLNLNYSNTTWLILLICHIQFGPHPVSHHSHSIIQKNYEASIFKVLNIALVLAVLLRTEVLISSDSGNYGR